MIQSTALPARDRTSPSPRPHAPGWDFLLLAVSAMILLDIWRVHQLFPVLAQARAVPIATGAMYLAYLTDRDPRRAIRTLNHPLIKLMLGLYAVAVLSVVTSIYQGDSFRMVIDNHPKRLAFVVILAASVRSMADLRRLGAVYLLGAVVYFVVILTGIGPWWASASTGVFYDNNDYAMMAVCALPLAAFFILRSGLGGRVLAGGVAVLLVLAVAVSGSRTGFLGLVTWGVYLLFWHRGMPQWLRGSAIAAGVAAFAFAAGEAYKSELSSLLALERDYNWAGGAPGGRMEIWRRGIGYMVDRPLLGVGVGQFSTAEGTRSSEAQDRRRQRRGWKWSAAHNSYIQIGAELGLGGLVLFLATLAVGASGLRRIARGPPGGRAAAGDEVALAEALLGTLAAFAVTAFFLSHAYSTFYYVVLGLVVGLSKVTPWANPGGYPTRTRSRNRRHVALR